MWKGGGGGGGVGLAEVSYQCKSKLGVSLHPFLMLNGLRYEGAEFKGVIYNKTIG